MVLAGRVLLPDGKPAVGAKVLALRHYWNQAVKRAPLAKTIAGVEGRFTIRIPKMTEQQMATAGNLVNLAAELNGFGASCQLLTRNNKTQEIVLKLVAESPIHGRIVDLEGNPVRGARVTLLWRVSPKPDFETWLAAVKSGSQEAFRLAMGGELEGYDDESQAPIVTNPEGRFTLRGVGADHVVHLAVGGESIAYAEIEVVTRPIKAFSRKLLRSGTAEVFGAEFTYHGLPTRPIVGTVRDAASGAPLAGVTVEYRRGVLRAETDAAGKYRLVGMPKGKERGDSLVAVPDQDRQPYFRSAAVEVPDSPGLGPLSIDFKLTRGIWISGRVTDKETGTRHSRKFFMFPPKIIRTRRSLTNLTPEPLRRFEPANPTDRSAISQCRDTAWSGAGDRERQIVPLGRT